MSKIITEWICASGHEGEVEGGFAEKNAPEKCPVCGADIEENEEKGKGVYYMNLENWLYRRDREEYILYLATVPNLFNSSVNIAHHKSRQEEAEQEIEMELRR